MVLPRCQRTGMVAQRLNDSRCCCFASPTPLLTTQQQQYMTMNDTATWSACHRPMNTAGIAPLATGMHRHIRRHLTQGYLPPSHNLWHKPGKIPPIIYRYFSGIDSCAQSCQSQSASAPGVLLSLSSLSSLVPRPASPLSHVLCVLPAWWPAGAWRHVLYCQGLPLALPVTTTCTRVLGYLIDTGKMPVLCTTSTLWLSILELKYSGSRLLKYLRRVLEYSRAGYSSFDRTPDSGLSHV